MPQFEAITPSDGTRPASCRGARVPAASPPPHLPTSRKALRASAGRRNAHLPRPGLYCLSFIVILPTSCASLPQSPRHLDIAAVCQTVLNNWPAISSRRNPSRSPGGQVSEMPRMANFRPPAPRGLQYSSNEGLRAHIILRIINKAKLRSSSSCVRDCCRSGCKPWYPTVRWNKLIGGGRYAYSTDSGS